MLNLLTASSVEELIQIGEAAKVSAVLAKALATAVTALEGGKKSAAKSAIQAALDALEGAEYGYPSPEKEESDPYTLHPLAEMGKDAAVKALKAALDAIEKGDLKAALVSIKAVKGQYSPGEEKKEEVRQPQSGLALGKPEKKEEVKPEGKKPDLVEVELAESATGTFVLLEESASDGAAPLSMKVEIIQPGWGNKKDNNYYSAELLKQVAPQFVGAKMFETNHKESETTNRTWVSTIVGHLGFNEKTKAPVYEVLAHAPDFIQRVKNLAAAEPSLLEKLECSIRARGRVRPGEMEGKKGNVVESITDIVSVDWVSHAGAGGKAVKLGEKLEEHQSQGGLALGTKEEKKEEKLLEAKKPEIKYLDEATVAEILEAATLSKATRERLGERKYLDQEAVEQAIKDERTYLREATGSGKVTAMGGKPGPPSTKSLEEVEARRDAINKKFLGR